MRTWDQAALTHACSRSVLGGKKTNGDTGVTPFYLRSLQKVVVISPLKTMYQLSCNPRLNLYHGFY